MVVIEIYRHLDVIRCDLQVLRFSNFNEKVFANTPTNNIGNKIFYTLFPIELKQQNVLLR
jgi:hypothetical protein